jgi:hypothetical protein
MLFAGVDAGANIFVELSESAVAAAPVAIKKNSDAKTCIALRKAALFRCCMFHRRRAAPVAICWGLSHPYSATIEGFGNPVSWGFSYAPDV